jgi:hypothetical protein
MTVETEERVWQWRYLFECPVPNCHSGMGGQGATSPDEATAEFKSHLASHAQPYLIKLTHLYLPRSEKKREAAP